MSAAPVSTDPGTTTLETGFSEFSLNKDSMHVENGTVTSTQPSSVAQSLREKPEGPRKTPIVDPVESAKPPTPATLTAEQEKKYESLLETVKSWKEIPA